MKKIIKPGRKGILTTIKRFRCLKCDCIFECDKDEYRTSMRYDSIEYFSYCPECSNIAVEIIVDEVNMR